MRQVDIRRGMTVRNARGERLGKVLAVDSEGIVFDRGFFKRPWRVSYDWIERIDSDELTVRMPNGAAVRERAASRPVEVVAEPEPAPRHRRARDLSPGAREVLRIPLAEEELVPEVHVRESRSVRLQKEVVVEEKSVTVPVARERIRIERVPVHEMDANAVGTEPLGPQTYTIPLREEVIEVRRRPVVREEIRVIAEPHRTEHRVVAEARRERVRTLERELPTDDTALH